MSTSSSTRAARRISLNAPARGRAFRLAAPHGPGAAWSSSYSPAGLHSRPWVARLRRALEQERFELHFQPIVSLRDGRISYRVKKSARRILAHLGMPTDPPAIARAHHPTDDVDVDEPPVQLRLA